MRLGSFKTKDTEGLIRKWQGRGKKYSVNQKAAWKGFACEESQEVVQWLEQPEQVWEQKKYKLCLKLVGISENVQAQRRRLLKSEARGPRRLRALSFSWQPVRLSH